jgi:hypothetical protein
VPDEVCKGLDWLAPYEYRPPALDDEIAARTASKLIDVEILGHIFEQSISDLEQLNQPEAVPAKAGPSRGWRGSGRFLGGCRGLNQCNVFVWFPSICMGTCGPPIFRVP